MKSSFSQPLAAKVETEDGAQRPLVGSSGLGFVTGAGSGATHNKL